MWEKCCGLNRFFLQWIFKDFLFSSRCHFRLLHVKGIIKIYEMKGSYRHIPTVRFSPLSCNQLLSQTLTGCWQLSGLEQLLLRCAFWPADGSVSSLCGKQSNAHRFNILETGIKIPFERAVSDTRWRMFEILQHVASDDRKRDVLNTSIVLFVCFSPMLNA